MHRNQLPSVPGAARCTPRWDKHESPEVDRGAILASSTNLPPRSILGKAEEAADACENGEQRIRAGG